MRTFVIGNSIVRGLMDPSWTTVCLPGADWSTVQRHIVSNLPGFSNSLIYIHIGPVRFTRIHKSPSRVECSMMTGEVGSPNTLFESTSQIFRERNINIVLCTVYPVDFWHYNTHLSRKHGTRLIMQDRYDANNSKIKSMVVVENQLITDFNFHRGMATPYMHKRIFTRRRGHYAFRARFLRDGLHPANIIVADWKREIKRVEEINRANIGRLREQR